MKRRKRHIFWKILLCLLAVLLCAAAVLYGNLGLTLLTMKGDAATGV